MTTLTRRNFLLGSLATGLLVACSADEQGKILLANVTEPDQLADNSSWLHIAADDTVTVVIPSTEMGQGAHTGLATLVADELDADWGRVTCVTAPVDETFTNPQMRMQVTGGSTSVQAFWEPMRKVGATARSLLVQAAAQRWQLPAETLRTDNSRVIAPDGRELGYGELAAAARQLTVPDSVALKSPDQFKLIGKSLPRIEGPDKVTGKAEFGIDVQLPDLRVATIAQSPVFGGKLLRYNEPAALAVRGVEAVVPLPGAVAVVANGYWPAQKGLKALAPAFGEGTEPNLDSAEISKRLEQALDKVGKPGIEGASRVLEAEYEVPYLAHATLEPMNCTAHVTASGCEIWVPSQSQSLTAKAASKITGFDDEQIKVHTTLLGGGFGRRGESDFVEQAVRISQALGKPVKLIWSREEDTQHDFYRPATLGRFQVGLDAQGMPSHWHNQFAGSSIFKRLFTNVAPGILSKLPVTRFIGDPVATEGAKEVPYCADNVKVEFEIVDAAVPVGFWRSVGHSYNAFFMESVIDEAAHVAGRDPYTYRRQLLQPHPRWLAVLNKAAEMANWGQVPDGHFQGIAVHKSFNAYVAQVVELSVDDNKKVRLHRIDCAVDCGTALNPDMVRAQMEGGIIFGLVAAAVGEITIAQGRVQQSNFHDYAMLRMIDVPDIHVELIPSGDAPGGVGEPGTPPIAPALTNALFAATGERLRQLPLSKAGYTLAPVRLG